ncbi:tyrosine-protein phosphatase [Gordonia sp. L191]|uniref:tyrosine-protein phosphatase n=1 Tax=Gordonia sp. L191 TaxID=2982699 RepID=UPI0024C08C4F|nr:tyrosine-protein phosphatase [Gordonia sp. L191]WHU47423.1 tyrosine-protein phosphatase [Gordonia sp. L191]
MTSRAPVNLRDLGTMVVVGGGRTRVGALLRSDAPYDGDDLSILDAVPVRTVIDLRSEHEAARQPYRWSPTVTVHRRPLYDAGDLGSLSPAMTLTELYRGMLAASRPRIAALPKILGHGGATLIHCTAGKDRTGMAVGALLLLVGVDPTDVARDYRATEDNMPAVLERAHDAGVIPSTLMRPEWAQAPDVAIDVLIDEVTRWPGGARAWFLDHGASPADLDSTIAWLTAREN